LADEGKGPAISARGISKSFGRQKALDCLSMEIPSGITYCLLGPNGSGKTTFIRSAVGLLRLDGEIWRCWADRLARSDASTLRSVT